MSPNTQIGKTRAHRIAAANTAHAVSGVLINMGMLMMVCTVAALCTIMLCTVAACCPPIIAAVAVAGVAAVLFSVITGCSIRDLVESCRQVKQVKEEGLATVQSLQPVLTHVTPIAERTGNGRIAKLLTGKAKAEDAAQAAVDQGTAVGGTNKVIAGVATSSGIVKVMAEADPSTLKDAIKAVGTTPSTATCVGTCASALAGGVTGTAVVTGVGIAACVAGLGVAAVAAGTAGFVAAGLAVGAFSILISICTVIQTVAELHSARVPVVSMQDPVHKRDTTEYDVIENYKPQKISRIKWLAPPEAASPTHRILMALAGAAVVACISILLCCCLPGTIAVVAPPLVSCVFYGLSSCVGGIDAYVYKRKAAKAALPVETSPIVLGQRASECPEQLQNEVAVETANMTSDSVQQTQDWEPVAKDAEWEPIQQGPVGAKESGVDGTSQAPSDKADIMKSLERDTGFLSAAGDLFQAMTADLQNWEPVAPKTVAQPSRAR
ncbi:hypothetical protein DOS86_01915 [Anaplasma marginale]|uniref:hypothetical protein n=1 Tax=Anaplasma marginale TaxID=770 RepID=UPI000DEF865F|nr:hypothetical protein [Anaplasma marginale]RCL19999.1 hypothetical protein DOS86_01915 [Anaplasma marginale]